MSALEMEDRIQIVKSFKKKYALEVGDEIAAIIIHLMTQHRLDEHAALDQSSKGGADEGIDAWHFDEKSAELFIYQSKFSTNKQYVLRGFGDIKRAKDWLESVMVRDEVEKNTSNTVIYNLFNLLSQKGSNIQKITFILTSLVNGNELEDENEYKDCIHELINSDLNKKVKIGLKLMAYILDETALPLTIKSYPVTRIEGSTVKLPDSSTLDLAYVPLFDLVELHRRRGYLLFDKNIRLSISYTKEAKERLVNPMEDTLELICEKKLDTNIFAFYHIGVTVAATKNVGENKDLLLEYPYIINGCQTITIADNFLKRLENNREQEKIQRFKEIKVIAKIVIGVPDGELRQITNANNRQNPIENWQLFSNDPIHIDIAEALENAGVFYERQKGKFETIRRKPSIMKNYPNTNNTFVGVFDLGQLICLGRRNLQWAAKPSEIFVNKKNHDSVFDQSIPNSATDIILVSNAFKGIKRSLTNHLDQLTYNIDVSSKIFNKPLVRTYVHHIALMQFYQEKNMFTLREWHSKILNVKAPKTLVDEFDKLIPTIVTKTRKWYIAESKNLENDVSKLKLDGFLTDIFTELGINPEGPAPFTKYPIT